MLDRPEWLKAMNDPPAEALLGNFESKRRDTAVYAGVASSPTARGS